MINHWCRALALAGLLVYGSALCAQEVSTPPETIEAAPAASQSAAGEIPSEPALEKEATGAEMSEAQKNEKLNLTINLDLIDLDKLRQAVEEQQPQQRLQMTLDECIRIALANNEDIKVVEYEPLKAQGDITSARGEFDPVLSGTSTYLQAAQSTASDIRTFGGVDFLKTYRTTGQAALSGKLVTGTQYQLSLDMSKEETTFNKYIEDWQATLSLTVTQPLLKGFGIDVNRTRIIVAKNTKESATEQMRRTVMTTTGDVIKAYWDLVGAVEQLRVREESLANAERLLDINEKRFKIGTAAAIDVLQAKAGVATRQSDLISARSRVSDQEDVLKKMLSMRKGGFLSTVHIVPTDRPVVGEFKVDEIKAFQPTAEESMAKAVEYRPELKMAQLDIDSAKAQRKQSKNELLPQLDVGGSVGSGGRAHFPEQVFTEVRQRSNYSYTVSVTGSIPIGNRTARGAYQRADETLSQAEERYQKTLQDIMLEVKLAARGVVTSQILVESNHQARLLQEANVIAEEKRLDLGVTTSYRVLQVQEDLTTAQTQEVQAMVNYQKALTDLRVAEGIILDQYDIDFSGREGHPISFAKSVMPFVKK